MSLEGVVQRRVWLAIGAASRVFRLNTGKGWVSGAGPVRRLQDGSVVVPSARPIALGLASTNGDPIVGAADLIGWTPVVVTPDMVGKTVAVFTAIETKRTKGGKASGEQLGFLQQVSKAGGIAGVANSEESALDIFDHWRRTHT